MEKIDLNLRKEVLENAIGVYRSHKGIEPSKPLDEVAVHKAIEKLIEYQAIGTVEEFRALKNKLKYDVCTGCTTWKGDYANIRERVTTEFAEQLKNKLVLKYGNATVTQQYVAMQVTDWCNEIAEKMKKQNRK
ncbi:MAG: hypothetical protein UHN47_06935 [Lachnospiraceae bacterium]|nr:hypothetical protein [Lachnospiraceae bacterium]